MLVIGITGGIASGKSIMSEELKKLGAHVLDADVISREVVARDAIGAKLIKETFGERFFVGGELDRRALSDHVFSNPFQLGVLNALLHPLIKNEIAHKLNILKSRNVPVAFVVVPLLIESNMTDLVDVIWVVHCPEEIRIKRAMERDNISKEQVQKIIARQANDQKRLSSADKVFYNDGDTDNFLRQIRDEYNTLLKSLPQTNG